MRLISEIFFAAYKRDYLYSLPEKISLKNIEKFIEIGEIYPVLNDYYSQFYLNYDKTEMATNSGLDIGDRDTLIQIQQVYEHEKSTKNLDILVKKPEAEYSPLPPCSAMSFKRNSLNISSVLVSDFETIYQNKFLGSVFDKFDNQTIQEKIVTDQNSQNLAELVTVLTKSVVKMAIGLPVEDLDALVASSDPKSIKNYLDCFFVNQTCDALMRLFPSTLPNSEDSRNAFQKLNFRYAGTAARNKFTSANYLLSQILRNFIGKHLGEKIHEVSEKEFEEVQAKGEVTADVDYFCNKTIDIFDQTVVHLIVFDAVDRKYLCYQTYSFLLVLGL